MAATGAPASSDAAPSASASVSPHSPPACASGPSASLTAASLAATEEFPPSLPAWFFAYAHLTSLSSQAHTSHCRSDGYDTHCMHGQAPACTSTLATNGLRSPYQASPLTYSTGIILGPTACGSVLHAAVCIAPMLLGACVNVLFSSIAVSPCVLFSSVAIFHSVLFCGGSASPTSPPSGGPSPSPPSRLLLSRVSRSLRKPVVGEYRSQCGGAFASVSKQSPRLRRKGAAKPQCQLRPHAT